MVSTFIGLLDIQSWWEIPCIAHFCSLFSSAFNLPDIDIEDLETALLNDGTDETVGLLPELIVRLLKGCDVLKNRNEITTSNYQMFLRRFLRQQCRKYKTENYFDTDIDFQSLPLRNKLLILHSLCHFRLESKNVQNILSNLEADSLRVEPLGYDSKNSGYWYFFGTRLYREDIKQGGKTRIWQVICFTEEDWQNLTAKFKDSVCSQEQALYNILAENFIPKLPQLFRERERLRRRKLLQVRNSVRIRNLIEEKQKEIEKEKADGQKIEELNQEPADRTKTRSRRRSQTDSTASGISTYASSGEASTISTEFQCDTEEHCNLSNNRRKNKIRCVEEINAYIDNDETDELDTEESEPGEITERKCSVGSNISAKISTVFSNQENKENCVEVDSFSSKTSNFSECCKDIEMAPANNIKLPGRQTNNSLSSLAANIFIPPTVFGNCTHSTENERKDAILSSENKRGQESSHSSSLNSENFSRKKKLKLSDVFTETDEVLQIGMHKVLVYVKNHRDAWPFMDPVEEDIAPRYYSIIRRPMDLLKMEEKLDSEEYKKFSEFRNDFKLIVNNCRLYNGQNNEYTDMVNNLQEAFDKATKKYFDQTSSDEDINLEFPNSKTNVFREKYFNKNNTVKNSLRDAPKRSKVKKDKQLLPNKFMKDVDIATNINQNNEKYEVSCSITGKKKRKDKDKRHKKKSKTTSTNKKLYKESSANSEIYTDKTNAEQTDAIIDETALNNDSNKEKVSRKRNEKNSKNYVEVAASINFVDAESCKKADLNKAGDESIQKQPGKLGRAAKNLKKSSITSAKEGKSEHKEENEDGGDKSEKDFSSDNSLFNYPIRHKTKLKNSTSGLGRIDRGKKLLSRRGKCARTSKNKIKQEKENQISISKLLNKRTSSLDERKKNLPTDIKKVRYALHKKRKTRNKKANTVYDPSKITSKKENFSLKKRAESASSNLENVPVEVNLHSEKKNVKSKIKRNKELEEELLSISSHSFSRHPSPFNSAESTIDENGKVDNEDMRKKESTNCSQPKEQEQIFFPFMDKYDLIKQRRNRNTDEKLNQSVKETDKLKDNKKNIIKPNSISAIKEKNQKLKDTIEKLKVKNAKSKEGSVLIDEIFGVKPTQETRDEKTIFEKIRETCLDAKVAPSNQVAGVIASTSDEYDFVDDIVDLDQNQIKKNECDTEKSKDSKKNLKKQKSSVNSERKQVKKTNMEALELETEQTLKDINRWLEHTPRFSEFSSASNSPSRYNLLDDFDSVASKLDPADFRRPVPISTSKTVCGTKLNESFDDIVDSKKPVVIEFDSTDNANTGNINNPITTNVNNLTTNNTKCKESATNTTTVVQMLPHPPPPPPNIKCQQQKESKRKSLKEKLSVNNRRKDLLRTIDRLQPGKLKGNLISNMHNASKQDEPSTYGISKSKEIKNSLVVQADDSGPKLSLGSVLDTEGFGLGQLHSFGNDNVNSDSKSNNVSLIDNISEVKNEVNLEDSSEKIENIEEVKNIEKEIKTETKTDKSATPNLSAWFKAFGAPKKAKKIEEDDKKVESSENCQSSQEKLNHEVQGSANSFTVVKSPSNNDSFSLPTPRQRKASTGSTISERSSFSQDPDSPRVGIDERYGVYSGTYASPLGASPIMISPKQEEVGKSILYPLNGAIKVGFYQDTTTKSSPEKSCSPREISSPYPQYSHIYSSGSSPTINSEVNTYGNCYNTSVDQNKMPCYNNTNNSSMYDQYKQPESHETDYNSVNPNTNPNSPYQQSQNSPYQHQSSPYQQPQSSPYQASQNSPYHTQSSGTVSAHNAQSCNNEQSPIQQQQNKSSQDSRSPYHQTCTSPYQHQIHSYQQNSASPYEQSQTLGFVPQQSNVQQTENTQPTNENSFQSSNVQQYNIHDENSRYRQTDQNQIKNYNQGLSKRPVDIMSKVQQDSAEWNNQIELPGVSSPQNSETNSETGSINILTNQLNTPQLHSDSLNSMNQIQVNEKPNLAFSDYTQFSNSEKNDEKTRSSSLFNNNISVELLHQRQISEQDLSKCNQENVNKRTQSNERELISIGYREPQSDKIHKREPDVKTFESTLNKQQQMFDSFLGSMGGSSKGLGFSKPVDISTSKAFEMFNRAATIGFNKEFPSNISEEKVDHSTSSVISSTSQSQQISQPSYNMNNTKNLENLSNEPNSSKSVNIISSNFNQMNVNTPNINGKAQTYHSNLSATNINNKLDESHQSQSIYTQDSKHPSQRDTNFAGNLIHNDKAPNDIMLPSNRQDQMGNIVRNQHLNMDLTNYKPTFNNPASILDPLRNLNHPLAMIDDNMLNMQNSSSAGYYDKNIPPAHMYTKSLAQPVFQTSSNYNSRDPQNIQTSNNFVSSPSASMSNVQSTDQLTSQKPIKKTKKKKNAVNNSVEIVSNQNQNSILSSQPQSHQVQSSGNLQNTQNQQQGFQLYSGLKTAVTSNNGSNNSDTTSIPMKSTSTLVPGSAFNFAPAPSAIGLPTAIYGENTNYLDDFRAAPNPYYIPPTHRTSTDSNVEKATGSSASASPAYHQFLSHAPPRSSYPFMNSPQLDPNSPIYQQYLQRQQEEIRARMMLNQGLLGPSGASGYTQSNYRPTLGMPKHYDMNSMNRQTWF